ncbi:orotate phosphoribosyltransferase [Coriobacterium glomerans PW2]|uniref:Orotate phosphoribosyltransferase n=1 Tax=Coriobacterium glomerans (strain ATCC 49209 / DSM 20642 / JCM 10262 / PW2) TaxID=700015 RepID=F2NA02_CORGP|nr:orotate phosphoribosyltransferase [Coriobacterium glomerans]AEB06257.1 orotate phosphoribosyltransferase [Coriobacterium glomerans PW2]
MEAYKREFIELMIECDALRFGDFLLKSGRRSPFFLNTGAYVTGGQLKRLGQYYAKAIRERFGLEFDVLFGPAYKGIPLAVTTATALHDLYGIEVRWCANRKETKDHGADAGELLGSALRDKDRVIIVEDVTTSGRSIEETQPIIAAAADVEIRGLIVSLDRMEVGREGGISAQREIEKRYGFPVTSIVDMNEVIAYLSNREVCGRIIIDEERRRALEAYYLEYGCAKR